MSALSEAAKAHNAELHHENYMWYKERGICQNCKRGYADPGRVYCGPCYRRMLTRREKNDPGRVKRNAYNRERRERLKAAGLCVDCGRQKPVKGRTRCFRCEQKMKESRDKHKIMKKIEQEVQATKKRLGGRA